MNNYEMQYAKYKEILENGLVELFSNYENDIPELLLESMKYSVLNGGKRMRGVLMLATSDAIGVDFTKALKYAMAIEMIHAYSLIHDDLPCMDNDTLRRGMPCNHIKFGEGNALLAGDGLLNFAYEILLESAESIEDVKAISYLANCAGVRGMIKGQSLDVLNEGKEINFETLKTIHACKTGKLLKAAVTIPSVLKGDDKEILVMETFGDHIGIAFQIRDDVLDVIGNQEEVGKTIGKDEDSDKLTYIKIFGITIRT